MINGFEFEDAGRTYSCTVEAQKGPVRESWWWFSVTGDAQRYAPFRAANDDTRSQVQKRIVAVYEHRLFALTQPTQRGAHWGRKPGAPTPAAPDAGAATA
jgi:hypothetical protein